MQYFKTSCMKAAHWSLLLNVGAIARLHTAAAPPGGLPVKAHPVRDWQACRFGTSRDGCSSELKATRGHVSELV